MGRPRTVRVPPELEAGFAAAEAVVSRYFGQLVLAPERGTIEVAGERYLLVRAASLSVGFFSLVRELFGAARSTEADDFSRNLLFDLAHAVGRSDARAFHERMGLSDPLEKLTAGPVHFSHTGWAFVDLDASSVPAPDDDYHLLYDHPYSFEATSWLEAGDTTEFPVCIMSAGYSSGWCEQSFGMPLVASEVLCRARGDVACRFVMAPPTRIEEHVRRWVAAHPEMTPRGQQLVIPDFFARKKLEDELRRARDELEVRVEARTRDLRDANAKLHKEMADRERAEAQLLQTAKLEAVGRLAGGIAHDFNNLMTVVIGQATMLERSLAHDAGLLDQLRDIKEAGQRAVELNEQLLAFSRTQIVRRAPLRLDGVVGETLRMLGRVIGEDIEVTSSLHAGSGTVLMDRAQLGQVVMNLVLNARDAMPDGGRLEVRTFVAETFSGRPGPSVSVVLEVADDGIGMDEATVARAFDPFFTTKEPGRGTGLGLASVYGIVVASGGTIEARSAPGAGTTFTVRLPAHSASDDVAPVPGVGNRGAVPKGTVLLAEDQPILRRLVAGALRAEGHVVLEAANPAEALSQMTAHAGPIDYLVTDVVMPHGTGRDIADAVRARYPDVVVLFMSGYASDEILRRGVEAGTEALIEKPFTPDQLVARLESLRATSGS